MSPPAITIRDLSKCYRLGTINRHTLVDEAAYWWHKIRGKDPRSHFQKIGEGGLPPVPAPEAPREDNLFWALRGISLEVQPGEVVGVIGRNGAGKSTLLKILTRITEPTTGEIFLNGRVASLLEVGTGFHPELTGRENIYMNGAILGMKRREITSKFDEIVDFSEIGTFIDTPVKRYSSGMYVRLAFAVAAHLEPEILIVDEVLAVGDQEFQRKCLGKMGEVAQHGRTVLFVSHNMASIQLLCKRGILLHKGQLGMDGDIADVVHTYIGKKASPLGLSQDVEVWIGEGGQRVGSARVGVPFHIHVRFPTPASERLAPNIVVYDANFQAVFSSVGMQESTAPGSRLEIDRHHAQQEARILIPPGTLNQGEYFISFLVLDERCKVMERHDHCLALTVLEDGSMNPFNLRINWIGVTRPCLHWEIHPC